MPLESASFISDLDANNPAQTDNIFEGDDHIRLIKAAVKSTFPNVTGAVTLTQDQINDLAGDAASELAGEVTELRKHIVPKGTVMMWSGSIATIPAGWGLCDGTLQSGTLTPDLRNKFIVGAGDQYIPDAKSADDVYSKTTENGGAHDHGGATGGHALTEAEMPAHTHTIQNGGNLNSDVTDGGVAGTANIELGAGTNSTDAAGSGSAHSHSITSDSGHTHDILDARPPWYALAYIIKLNEYVAPA